jgi:hypothetical protein
MAPDLKEMVSVSGNGTRSESVGSLQECIRFCRSIIFNVKFCEGLKVRFCMPVKMISNAKYGKINPMSYLSDEICNI